MDRTGLDGPLVGISCEDSSPSKRGGDTGRLPGKSDSVIRKMWKNPFLVACLERFGLFEVRYFRKLFFFGGKVSGLDRV